MRGLGSTNNGSKPVANAPSFDKVKIAVIGLGYVGLPLAVHLSRKLPVIGFDIDARRVDELQGGHDRTREWTDGRPGSLPNT